ncbi:unnamed protein product [Adineta steineri]|uniref:NACHT domain-containing protein n=1 Tax=Adineta steineri TaxID=433720 RepID=A0A816B261_9BILA|nr:unnamed protein product [Adineta steineri]CAF1603768.1 unnamed protein product [Adineta steineri]
MNDDEIIIRAINIIDQKIDSLDVDKENPYYVNKLMVIREDLEKLFSLTSSTNNLVHLFCRRMNKLLNYNDSIPLHNWLELQKELLHILEHHDDPTEKLTYIKFSSILKLESKLEEREIQFKKNFGHRKTFHELVEQHRILLREYLQICYSLHSKLKIHGLVEDVDKLCQKMHQQTDILQAVLETNDRLQAKLKSIEIPITYPFHTMKHCMLRSFLDFQSRDQMIDNNNVFLPGMDEIQLMHDSGISIIHNNMAESRWFVILGDPGSAKTTLLRYITQLFSLTALQHNEQVINNRNNWGPIRIPILIRIGEFADQLNIQPNLTLFDYIGKQTWFSQFYGNDNIGYVLKEFIHHGHTLILLDGLDEISTFEQRQQIINLVQDFIHNYIHGDDFLSPFDDVPNQFNKENRQRLLSNETISMNNWRFNETQPPSMSGGNQIIITSRVVGCNLYRFDSQLISYYNLLPMSIENVKLFIEQWFTSVDQEIHNILMSENIHLDNKTIEERQNTINRILPTGETTFLSHPLMLSMVCLYLFKLWNDNQLPKTLAELYNETVRSVMYNKKNLQQSRIPQDVLIKVETNLALYLHSHLSSGVIDEFDLKRICSLVLKEENVVTNKAELCQYIDELIQMISSNNSIIVERGLKVFSFAHLSFQEYFVGLSLLDESSIDNTIRRILTYTIKPRSHEPIRLAHSWISQMWPRENYVTYCRKLVTETIDSVLPLGSLLLLDVLHSFHCLPSKAAIYTALDKLIDHPSMLISTGYLGKGWSILPLNILFEWMKLSLINEKRVVKFCNSFLFSIVLIEYRSLWENNHDRLRAVCQQLWSLCSMSSSIDTIITKTLHGITTSLYSPCLLFQNGLPQYLMSPNIFASQKHPLVFSVIITLYGGVFKKKDEMIFSPKYINRNSRVGTPVIDYLANTNDSHLIKIERLIQQYENMLQMYSPEDISNDVIDIIIVLICLHGLSNPSIYSKFAVYQALPLALERFNLMLYLLRDDKRFVWNKTTQKMFSDVKLIIDVFASQSNRTDVEIKRFLLACMAACDRLGIDHLPYSSSLTNLFNSDTNRSNRLLKYSHNKILNTQSTPVCKEPTSQAIKDVHQFNDQVLILMNFVPDHLKHLYHRLLIKPDEQCDSFLFILLLSQCLNFFTDRIQSKEIFATLNDLLPMFRAYKMENYVLALFWESKFRFTSDLQNVDYDYFQKFSTNYSKSCKDLIIEEQQRILEANELNDVRQKDIQLFAASFSLARLCQVQYRYEKNTSMGQFAAGNEQIVSAIENINDQILSIIAMHNISYMDYKSILSSNPHAKLRSKVAYSLLQLLPNLPLLTCAVMVFRCQSICEDFQSIFRNLSKIIAKQLLTIPLDEEMVENQKAVYVALNSMEDSSLNILLIEFEKQFQNVDKFSHMNSIIFHDYFTTTTSFGELDEVLLSCMYLSELIHDVKCLRKYVVCNKQQKTISLSERLRYLLNTSREIITLEMATLITNYIEKNYEKELGEISGRLIERIIVEKDAQPVLLQLLNLPAKESRKSLFCYIALLLAKHGSIAPNSIDYIKSFCQTTIDEQFKYIIKQYLELPCIDSEPIRQIVKTLLRCIRHSSLHIDATICSCEIMKLILQLENEERRTNNGCVLCDSYFMLINGCSFEVQNYLLEYLDANSKVQNSINEQRLIRIITWIMQHFATKECPVSNVIYKYIISLFHDQKFSRIQETIINSFQYIFMKMFGKNIFTNQDVKRLLEDTINLCVKTIDDNSENLLANCLHAYGYCLRFYKYYCNEKPSNEMIKLLTKLSQTYSSSFVAIRAGQCLLIIELYIDRGSISDWLNKTNLNVEQIYNIFIHCTSDEHQLLGYLDKEKALNHILLQHPTDLLPKFINEMYMYLNEKPMNCNLSKRLFSYINATENLCQDNFTIFRTIMEKCFHNIEQFKILLYQISKHGNNDIQKECILLYIHFGEITSDFITMLLSNVQYAMVLSPRIEALIANKRILLDRDIIEHLHEALQSPSKEKCALQLLISLAQVDFISILEVFKQISDIINKRYSLEENNYQKDYEQLIDALLKFTCIQAGTLSSGRLHQLKCMMHFPF